MRGKRRLRPLAGGEASFKGGPPSFIVRHPPGALLGALGSTQKKGRGMKGLALLRRACVGLMLALLPIGALGSAVAQRKEVPAVGEGARSFAPIVRKAAPAVVNVYVRARVQTFVSPFADDPFFRRFF